MEQPWRSAAALVFVDDVGAPALSEGDAHHLSRVLRLAPGTMICVTDGAGRWRLCELAERQRLTTTDVSGQVDRPGEDLTVGLALVKGEKPELVVQKLTEIGVDRIVFFSASRSVVRWNSEKVERNLARLRKVAGSACAQSRRLHLPKVEVSDLSVLLAEGAAVADFGGRALRGSDRMVLIGPEGGWENGEYGDADSVDLGPNVLRAETAAISAAVQLCSSHSAS